MKNVNCKYIYKKTGCNNKKVDTNYCTEYNTDNECSVKQSFSRPEIPSHEPSPYIRKWKNAKTNPPTESGRYWCYIKEQKDLGVSYYEWNCSFNTVNGFCKPDHNTIEITHYTELLGEPCE